MHRFIPFAIEFLKGIWIPPILVKLTTVELADLRKEVADVLEDEVEHEDDGCSDGNEQSEKKLSQMNLWALQDPRLDILCIDEIKNDYDDDSTPNFTQGVEVIDTFSPWIIGVDKPRSQHKQDKIVYINVFGVIWLRFSFIFYGIFILLSKVSTLIFSYRLTVIYECIFMKWTQAWRITKAAWVEHQSLLRII